MHRKITLLAVSAALLASSGLAACGGDDEATPAAAAEPAAQQHESPSHEQRHVIPIEPDHAAGTVADVKGRAVG